MTDLLRNRLLRLLAVLFAAGLLLAACGDDGGDDGGDGGGEDTEESSGDCEATVCMEGIAYTEESVIVNTGDTVAWTNLDDVDHTVTEGTPDEPVEGGFDSGNIGPGESFELTPDAEGVIDYFCTIHPQMVASLSVE